MTVDELLEKLEELEHKAVQRGLALPDDPEHATDRAWEFGKGSGLDTAYWLVCEFFIRKP